MSQREKIVFKLAKDDDDYPPIDYEGIWAEKVGENLYKIDGIPFFAREATHDDVVKVKKKGKDLLFHSLSQESENSLIRVVYFDDGDPQVIRKAIEGFGCSTEWDKSHALISVNVPNGKALQKLTAYLVAEANKGLLDYEEAILRA